MAAPKLNVKTGDTVVVISGKDKGKQGKVNKAMPKEGKIIVKSFDDKHPIAQVTKHQKPRGQGMPGGIIKTEAAIPACKVMIVCPSCKKATRVAHKFVEVEGKKPQKVRACKKCGASIDN